MPATASKKPFRDPALIVYGRRPPQHASHLLPSPPALGTAPATPAIIPQPAELAGTAGAAR